MGLLELGRLLGGARFRRTVMLVAVDHEELGFHGARHVVRTVGAQRNVVGAYVFEMLGFASSVPGSQHLIPGLGLLYPGQVRRIRRNEQRGDFSAVLYRRSGRTMAALFAANFRNPHYHQEGDVPATVSMKPVADVVAATAYAVEVLAERLNP